MLQLTHTALDMFMLCPRKFEHRYVNQIVPAHWTGSPAMRFGTAMHRWLEAWHQGRPTAFTPEDEVEAAKYRAATAAYQRQYPSDTWTVIDAEATFTAPITFGNQTLKDIEYAGARDLLVAIEGEGKWLVEHKTSATLTPSSLERVALDAQTLRYILYGSISRGERIEGVIYNVIKSCALRLKAKEELADYENRVAAWYADPANGAFMRERRRVTDEMLEAAERNVWSVAKMILACHKDAYYPQNGGILSGACMKWQRECEYAAICKAGKSREESVIATDYRNEAPNKELQDGPEME